MEEPTPDQIRLEFLLYRKSCHETLGQFLANYHRRWLDASKFDIGGMEAIIHLIPLLPSEWQGWATSLIPQYIDRTLLGSFYGDLGGFIATLSHQYYDKEVPPSGPALMPQNFLSGERMSGPMPQFDPTPFMFSAAVPASSSGPSAPFSDILGGEGDRQSPIHGHEAGASRSSRGENDIHNFSEPIIPAGIQNEPIQVTPNGVVVGGAAPAPQENGEAINGGEEIVGPEMDGEGRSEEVAENGVVNHEPREGTELGEETEPSEASSAGSND